MRIIEYLALLSITLYGLTSTAHAVEPSLQEWRAEKQRATKLEDRADRWNRTDSEAKASEARKLLEGKRGGKSYEDAKGKLDDVQASLDSTTALLLEVEPITIVEIPLQRTKLDGELRGSCDNFGKVPVATLACVLSDEDCGTQTGRVAATQALPDPPPTFEAAVKAVHQWEDPAKSIDEQVDAGVAALRGLLGRVESTQALCRATKSLDLDAATLQSLLTFARLEELAEAKSLSSGLSGSTKLKEFEGALKPVREGLEARRALAEAEARPLEPGYGQGKKDRDVEAARKTASSAMEAALVGLREGSAMVRGYEGGRGAFIEGGALLGGSSDAIVEGLAEFLLTRAKEEAINYVRDVFVAQLCGGDILPFVRSTCEAMAAVEHTTALRAIGRSLKQAMESDLRRLPDVGLVFAATYSGDRAYLGTTIRLAMAIIRASRSGADPLASAWSLHVAPKIDCEATKLDSVSGVSQCRKTVALMRSASALLYAIQQQDSGSIDGYWVVATMIGWKARWEEMRQLGVAPSDFAPPTIDAAVLQRVEAPLVRVGHAIKVIQDVIPKIRRAGSGNIDATADLLSAGVAAVGAMKDAAAAVRCALEPAQCLASSTTVAASTSGVATIGYHPSISAIAFVRTPPDPLNSAIAKASGPDTLALISAVTAKDWAAAAPATLKFLEPYVEGRVDPERWAGLKEFVPVLVEIGQATSSADVAVTLEAAIPAGGYRSKYRAPMLAINGFVGGAFTYEGYLYYVGENGQWVDGASVALFAPVGLHVAGPVRAGKAKPWAMGGLLSVLDLGTITARTVAAESVEPVVSVDEAMTMTTTTTEVDEVAALDIRQLFSPGAYFTLGIAESPATVGAGLSYNPFLRDATSTTSDGSLSEPDIHTERVSVLRVGVFVAIDVTMFAFRLSRRRR